MILFRFLAILILIFGAYHRADAHQIKISSMEFEIRDGEISLYAPLVPIEVLADTTTVEENRPLSRDQLAEVFSYFAEKLLVHEGDARLSFVGDSAAVLSPDTATMSPALFRDTSPLDHLVVSGHFERSKENGVLKIEAKELFREMGAYPPMVVGRIIGAGYDEVHAFDGFAPWSEPLATGFWPGLWRGTLVAGAGLLLAFSGYYSIFLLLGLQLLSLNARGGLKNIAAFAVSYALTFALRATEILILPASFIEPVIALTIVYIGVENLLSPLPRSRWKIAIFFGLIHGLLGSVGMGRYVVFTAALSVVLLFSMGIRLPLRKRTVQVGSILLSIAGLYWFIERAFL